MFEGTAALSQRDATRLLAEAGLSAENAITSDDSTYYFEQVAPRGLDFVLWMDADRMASVGASLDEDKLERVRAVVTRERLERIENRTASLAWVELQRALYPKTHPYARHFDATPQALRRITLDDARGFYRTHYTPDVATLVVAGDFDPGAAKARIAEYFGKIPRGRAVVGSPAKLAPPPLARDVRVSIAADVVQPFVMMAWVVPQLHAPGDHELDGLHAYGALLQAKLRKRGVVVDASISHPSHALGSEVEVYAAPALGVPWRTVEREVLRALDELDGRAYDDALASWAKGMQSAELQSFETPLGRASVLRAGVMDENDPWRFVADCAAWQGLSSEDVRRAVSEHMLGRKHVTVTVIGDPKGGTSGMVIGREGSS
jgi:zinc protease